MSDLTANLTSGLVVKAIGFNACVRETLVARVSHLLHVLVPDNEHCNVVGCEKAECRAWQTEVDAAVERMIDVCVADGTIVARRPSPETNEVFYFSPAHEARTRVVRVVVDVLFTEEGEIDEAATNHAVAKATILSAVGGMRRNEPCAPGVQILSIVGVSSERMPREHRVEFVAAR